METIENTFRIKDKFDHSLGPRCGNLLMPAT